MKKISLLLILSLSFAFQPQTTWGFMNFPNDHNPPPSNNTRGFGEEINEYVFNENFGGLVWVGDQLYAIDHPNCEIDSLNQFVLGPDFPTGGLIIGKKGIKEESLMKIIKEDIKLNKFFENKKNIKSIFIKDKLINLIIK